MELKIKHRILGILVIIGLIVLLLPLLLEQKEQPIEVASVKPPVFPEKPLAVAQLAPPTQLTTVTTQADPLLIAETKPVLTQETAQPLALPIKKIKSNIVKKEKKQSSTREEGSLSALAHNGWVVQVGSFKNKTNAMRLVNQLRLNGFSAFISSTTPSNGTRVLVGPEKNANSAAKLAERINLNLHVKGVVTIYQPLAL